MKKGLLYVFMFVMSAIAFSACSDDDDPNWQKLPEEIAGENLDIQINGVATSGTVNFKAASEEAAVLQLNGVIPGCEVVEINVEMTEQADGTFTFTGSQEVEDIEVRSEETVPSKKYMVNVSGSVSIEGKLKANLNITLELASLNGEKVYTGNTLKLSYSDREMVGKQVSMQVKDGMTASLSLQGIIPGEPLVSLSDIALSANGYKCDFTGTTTTTAGTQVAYTGSVLGDTLSLSLNVTLSASALSSLSGTWNILHEMKYNEDVTSITNAPFLLNWKSTYTKEGSGVYPSEQISLLASALVSHIIVEVLNNVNFEKDGNLTAKYYNTDLFSKSMDEIMAVLMGDDYTTPSDRVWESSPKNLAFWYTDGAGKLYIIPDLAMILKQIKEDGGSIDLGDLNINSLIQSLQTMSGAEVKNMLNGMLADSGIKLPFGLDLNMLDDALVEQIVSWLSTGVPLHYEMTNSGLKVYVDKEMVTPFMQIALSMLPMLQEEFDKFVQQPGNEMIGKLVTALLGIDKLTDLRDVWAATSAFGLGIGFEK